MDDNRKVILLKQLPHADLSPVPWRSWSLKGFQRTKTNRIAGEYYNTYTRETKIVGIDDITGVPLVLHG